MHSSTGMMRLRYITSGSTLILLATVFCLLPFNLKAQKNFIRLNRLNQHNGNSKHQRFGSAYSEKSIDETGRESRGNDLPQLVREACMKELNIKLGDRTSLDTLLKCQYNKRNDLSLLDRKSRADDKPVTKGPQFRPYVRNCKKDVINPHNFRFIHQPKPCTTRQNVLVSIHSAVKNSAKRAMIRNTWGNPKIFRPYIPGVNDIKLIFVLGSGCGACLQSLVDYESEQYNDIVQADFVDHYHNNTYKAIYHLKWASSQRGCPKTDMIIKSDDDVVFNLNKFPSFWNSLVLAVSRRKGKPTIAGNLYGLGPLRDETQKWYLPYNVYPYDTFPPWFQGLVYFLTPELAERMYRLSFTTSYIFTDDVYIGLLADCVDGIQRLDLSKYYNYAYDKLENKELKWLLDNQVFYHNPSVDDMYSLWNITCNFITCN